MKYPQGSMDSAEVSRVSSLSNDSDEGPRNVIIKSPVSTKNQVVKGRGPNKRQSLFNGDLYDFAQTRKNNMNYAGVFSPNNQTEIQPVKKDKKSLSENETKVLQFLEKIHKQVRHEVEKVINGYGSIEDPGGNDTVQLYDIDKKIQELRSIQINLGFLIRITK